MIINKSYILEPIEKSIVEMVARARQKNKELTGINGAGTVAKDSKHLYRNIIGFGAEFIFCKYNNIHVDFSIKNTSKKKGTDKYDAYWKNMTIDVKVTEKDLPLMTPKYSKTDVDGFAFFHCKYPSFTFKGFATNSQLFQKKNIKKVVVDSYVLELGDLLSKEQFLFLTKLNKHDK